MCNAEAAAEAVEQPTSEGRPKRKAAEHAAPKLTKHAKVAGVDHDSESGASLGLGEVDQTLMGAPPKSR